MEMPISHPSPNSPPSVNRVEALTYTAALSTQAVNFCAAALSLVIMASLTLFTKNHKYAYEDAAMMGENIMLAAHFLGLGACYVGRADEVFATEFGMECRKNWGVPENLFAVSCVLLGYIDGEAPQQKPRKPGRVLRV